MVHKSAQVRQEGILFAKVLSCTTCPGNNGAALLAARVLCEVLALLSILDRHGSVSDSETKALVGLTVGLGESHHREH